MSARQPRNSASDREQRSARNLPESTGNELPVQREEGSARAPGDGARNELPGSTGVDGAIALRLTSGRLVFTSAACLGQLPTLIICSVRSVLNSTVDFVPKNYSFGGVGVAAKALCPSILKLMRLFNFGACLLSSCRAGLPTLTPYPASV